MGVNLGGGQAAMAQQFFHSVQIGAIIHKMGGKSVAEHMGAPFIKTARFSKNTIDNQVGIFWI